MNKALRPPIFLSASIPYRDPYVQNSDPMLIREAILALVSVTIRERQLIFGGHPAISPLVDQAARTLGAENHVYIYQSREFEEVIPEVAKEFKNFVWTQRGVDKADSLRIMREQMIGLDGFQFAAAVFIGGMDGILAECDLFKHYHPGKPLFPIASTLGAARELFDRGEGPQNRSIQDALEHEKRYRTLFRQLFKMTHEV